MLCTSNCLFIFSVCVSVRVLVCMYVAMVTVYILYIRPTVTRGVHKCVNDCFDNAAELLRKNQVPNANKSEFCR